MLRHASMLVTGLVAANTAAAQWGYAQVSGPPAAYDMAMSHDLLRSQSVLLLNNTAPETWTYNGTWQAMTPAHTAPGRRFAPMAYDLTRGVTVVYGGRGNNPNNGQAADETWEWDGTDWTQMTPAGTPGGIESHAIAFDLARQRVVVYGGIANSWVPQALSTTWEYDGVGWMQISTATTPGARSLASACYHMQLGITVLFGGINPAGNIATDETWVYDGLDWRLVPIAGPKPLPRVQGQMVYDINRQLVVLFGGIDPVSMAVLNDLWVFDGTAWSEVTGATSGIHPPRAAGAMAMDVARNRLVYFGGRTANTAVVDETWEYGAQFRTFGNGCAGSNGVPRLSSSGAPHLGAAFAVTLGNLPASPFALMTTGNSRTTWALGPLPMLLTSFGMPNCRAYASANFIEVLPVIGGQATWTVTVPPIVALVGTQLHHQAIAFDPGVNAAGMVVSNAATAVIGY